MRGCSLYVAKSDALSSLSTMPWRMETTGLSEELSARSLRSTRPWRFVLAAQTIPSKWKVSLRVCKATSDHCAPRLAVCFLLSQLIPHINGIRFYYVGHQTNMNSRFGSSGSAYFFRGLQASFVNPASDIPITTRTHTIAQRHLGFCERQIQFLFSQICDC